MFQVFIDVYRRRQEQTNKMSTEPSTTPIVKLTNVGSVKITERIEELRRVFIDTYNTEPNYYIKVPGRVNLIGEHVDYCGYPVLPMAIEQCILLAVRPTDDGQLKLSNVHSKYETFNCDIKNVT